MEYVKKIFFFLIFLRVKWFKYFSEIVGVVFNKRGRQYQTLCW